VVEHVLRQAITEPSALLAIDYWSNLSALLTPLRLPLFFLISGYLAHSAIFSKPTASFWRAQVLFFLWLYALWTLLQWSAMTALLGLDPAAHPRPATTLWGAFAAALRSDSFLWYIYALPLYAATSRLLRTHQTWLLLPAVLACVAAHQRWIDLTPTSLLLPADWIYYVVGVSCRHRIERLHHDAMPARLLAAVAAFALLAAWGVHSQTFYAVWVFVPMSAAAMIAAIQAIALLGSSRLVVALAYFGRRTLPIYVIHPILLLLLSLTLGLVRMQISAIALPAVWLAPAVLAAALVALCLLIHRGLNRGWGRLLFALPSLPLPRRPTAAIRQEPS
jgi:uncharacterized membrane protein YcfT